MLGLQSCRDIIREITKRILTSLLFQAGVPALEWSPLEDEGRSAPAVLYTKKVSEHCECFPPLFSLFHALSSLKDFSLIRMGKEGKRIRTLTLGMNLTGLLSAQ